MAIKKFNSIDGFSVGSDTPIAVIDNVANVSANSLVVANKSNLGNVANITITGGSAGYVLKTDGTGNLSWSVDSATAGGNSTYVQFNDAGTIAGNSNFTFDKTTSLLTVTGNITTTGNVTASNANLGNSVTANYFTGNGTYLTGLSLNDSQFIDVSMMSPNLGQILGYNGTYWTNVNNTGTVSAGAGVDFWFSTPIINAITANNDIQIDSLSSDPNTSAQSYANVSVNGTAAIAGFVSPTLGRTVFDAGNWDFSIWANISATGGTNTINAGVHQVLPNATSVTVTGTGTSRTVTASSGTPFATVVAGSDVILSSYVQTPLGMYRVTAKTSDTIVTINTPSTYTNETAVAASVWIPLFNVGSATLSSTSFVEYLFGTTQPAYTVTTDSAIGVLMAATTPNAKNIYITINGTNQASHFSTPLHTLHDDLAGLQGGTANQYYHLTSSEYTGTGTGTFVRQANASLTSPNIDSAIGTSLNLTGNLTSGNASLGNLATANYLTGTLTTAAQPNITSLGNLSTLSVTGNTIIGGNANISGNIVGTNYVIANYFTGIITTTHQPNIESVGNLVGLTVSNVTGVVNFDTTANVSLGNISNLHILGGTAGYVLTTDGYGDLSWEAAGNAGPGFVSIRKDNFTGNGVQTQFPLSAIPSGEDAVEVNLNGLIQQGYVYDVVGSNVVFTTPPVAGANIEITTFGALAITQTDSQILYINGSNLVGSNNFTFTESNNTLSVNNISTTANVSAGNVKSDNLLYANGSPYIFTTAASGSNTQVQFNDSNSFAGSANFTFDKGTNTLSVTNIVANGSGITYITGSNVSGNVSSAIQSHYANIANSVSGSNVSGQVGNALIAGTVYTNAQPNITSVGTLTSLNVTGNVSANYFIGNGSSLTNITGSNVIGNVTSAIQSHYANTANSVAGSNVSGQVGNALIAGTVYTAAQPNITSVGTLTSLIVSGDSTITGNLIVSGNTEYTNVNNLYIKDPIIEMGGGANGAVLSSNDGKDRGSLLHYYTTTPVDAFMGWDNSNAEFAFGSNVSVTNEVVTFNSFGNVRANYFIGDGRLLTNINASNITGAYSNSNVASYLPTYTGNVSANYFIGNGSTLTNITGSNVTGNVTYAITSNWANTANSISGTNVSGNVSSAVQAHYANIANSVSGSNVTGQVGNALIAGTVYTAAQPNITSVGTLVDLTVTGTITAGNANIGSGTGGSLTGANLISANYFVGDGSLLTNINAANITGSYGNGNVANYLPTYTGNVSANYFIGDGSTLTNITGSNVTGNVTYAITSNWSNVANSVSGSNVSGQVGNALIAGTVYTNAQPNITSVGTLSNLIVSGDATITGNLTVSGNTNYINVDTLVVQDPIIEMGGGANGAPLTSNDGKDRGSLMHYYTTAPIDAFMGWDNSNGEFAFGSNVSVTNEVVTVNTLGNIRAGYFIGNGALLTGLPAQYANSNVANYLPTYTGNVSANYFIGDGSILTNITGANVTGNVTLAITSNWANTANSVAGANVSGQVGNALISGTVYTNAQPNITSVGTLSSLSVTGNITSNANSYAKLFSSSSTSLAVPGPGNVAGERVRLYDFGSPSSTNYAIGVEDHYIWTAVDATTAGFKWYGGNTLAATLIANGQFTTVGSINSANANLGNLVVANYFSGDGSLLTNINAGNITGSYGNSNVAAYLLTYTGNISANYFIGNGSTLTDITGPNVIGNVDFAITSNWANTANSISGANVSGNVDFAITSNWSNVANSVSGANVSGNVDFAITSNWANTANSISGTNVSGNVAEAVHAYYADVANSVSGSNVSGNVDFAITSNWANVANSVAGANVSGTVANATYATSAGSATSATTAGTVTTASQPNVTSLGTLTQLTVDGLSDLGPIGNITITGGTSGYVLTTNGAGDLSWQAAGGSVGPGFVNITKNSFTGNGVQTVFTLTTTPASEASLLVNIDGITQQDSAYSLSGSDVTFASAPFPGEVVEIVSYGSIGIGSNTTVLFNDSGDIGNTSSFSFNKYSNTLSVTNIDTTSITFDTGVITVSGANAGIFSSGIDNINLGLGANVTVGSTSGNTTIQGNLIAGNISTSSNLAITGTATISNLKVNDLYSNRTPVSVSTNTIVDSFPVNRYRSAKYTMRVNSDDGYQAVEVLLIHDGSDSYVTIYGSLSTIGTDIVTLSSNILSGNVRLLATSGSANTTVNLLGTYVAD